MNLSLPDKWIRELNAYDNPLAVAVRTLESRLGAIQILLPLAANHSDEDPEYIHQLRVWSRRTTTALKLYESLLPQRRCLWLKKQIKRIRRAANDARNCDVLIERLSQPPHCDITACWLETVKQHRTQAQLAVTDVYERLTKDDRLAQRTSKLRQRIKSRISKCDESTSIKFKSWARNTLVPLMNKFFAVAPHDQSDVAALHQFRIQGKELRYAIELLAGVFPVELRTRLYPQIEELQERLGKVNDLATSRGLLEQQLSLAENEADAAAWRELLTTENSRLSQASREFWEWCTPRLLADLQRQFELCLSADYPDDGSPPTKAKPDKGKNSRSRKALNKQ